MGERGRWLRKHRQSDQYTAPHQFHWSTICSPRVVGNRSSKPRWNYAISKRSFVCHVGIVDDSRADEPVQTCEPVRERWSAGKQAYAVDTCGKQVWAMHGWKAPLI